MGPKAPRGVWFGFPGLPGQRASDFFVLPDYPNPAKTLAGAACEGEDGGCPVFVADGNLRGEQDYVAKAGEAKTIIVSILLDIPLIKEGIFLQHHLTKGAVSHAHLEYSL